MVLDYVPFALHGSLAEGAVEHARFNLTTSILGLGRNEL